MGKKISALFMASLCSIVLFAQDHTMTNSQSRPVSLMQGYGNLHHPVSTQNSQAQEFFDQGLRLIYAFNHDEAERSFRQAATLDPKLAMAYWGIAEAVGPNYNDPASDERFAAAHAAIQKASDLSSGAQPAEQAYIAAMLLRFPADSKTDHKAAAEAYRNAMRDVAKKYPDDLDASVLFAESGMNLHPWGLWHVDGTPEDGTEEIVTSLESVLKRDPDHMGAVHYYIHATEASRSPQRALAGANKLAAMAPSAGHLVHMPAHVYIRTGDYQSAVETNEKAAAADRAYIESTGVQGIYPMMYYSHNLHFIAMCAAMNGNYPEAKKSADELAAHVAPGLKQMPALEGFMTIPLAVEVRFHRWDEILSTKQPPAEMPALTGFWHFSRGLALAGKGSISEAEAEYKIVADAQAATPADAIFQMPVNNHTKDILTIARDVLGAKIALAKHQPDQAISQLQEAVRVQDSLKYDEPADWFFPVRESLGAVLLMNGNASGAEGVFRQDLDRNPRNPRSLYGLQQALLAQNRKYDASFVQKEFSSSWKGDADALKLEDLV